MSTRMKTKQADYDIEFVDGLHGTEEKIVFVWYDNRNEDYLVSKTAQTLLGLSPYHTRVYAGPYSAW